MKSYWGADSVETKPDLTKLTSLGYPTDGNPAQGVEATLPGAAWFYLVGLMRSQIISACSKTEDPTLEGQYFECLRSFDWALEQSIDGSKIKASSIDNDRIKKNVIAFDRLAASAIASQEQAIAGIADNVLMTPEMVAKAIAALVPPAMPTGMIFPWPGETPPEGAIVADGRELSRVTYAGVFSVYGTKYGDGDGSTTFNVPDLDGRFIEFTTDALQVGKYIEAGLPNITGETGDLVGYPNAQGTGCFTRSNAGNAVLSSGSGVCSSDLIFSASNSNQMYGQASTVQPPALQLLPCIKI